MLIKMEEANDESSHSVQHISIWGWEAKLTDTVWSLLYVSFSTVVKSQIQRDDIQF